MEEKELSKRLREIVGSIVSVPENQCCWLDGSICSYGLPGGRFDFRPRNFCYVGEGGCRKLVAEAPDLEDFFSDIATLPSGRKWIAATLDGIAETTTGEDALTNTQAEVLGLAADIVRSCEHS